MNEVRVETYKGAGNSNTKLKERAGGAGQDTPAAVVVEFKNEAPSAVGPGTQHASVDHATHRSESPEATLAHVGASAGTLAIEPQTPCRLIVDSEAVPSPSAVETAIGKVAQGVLTETMHPPATAPRQDGEETQPRQQHERWGAARWMDGLGLATLLSKELISPLGGEATSAMQLALVKASPILARHAQPRGWRSLISAQQTCPCRDRNR